MGFYYHFIKNYGRVKESHPTFYPEEKDPIINSHKRYAVFQECREWTDKHRNALNHKDAALNGEHVNAIRNATKSLVSTIMTELKDISLH